MRSDISSKDEKNKDKKKDSKGEKSDKTTWSNDEDWELVAVLQEHKKMRNQAESGWKHIVWTSVVEVLIKKFPSNNPKVAKQCSTRFSHTCSIFTPSIICKSCSYS